MSQTLQFANPTAIPFAALALLPLAVHLLCRRKARPLPFPALEFLRRSQVLSSRSMRLRRIILFACRTTLLLALPLALARPRLVDGNHGGDDQAPSMAAVLLDASLSMGALDGDGVSAFHRGRKLAMDLVRSLPDGTGIIVVACPDDGWPPSGRDASRTPAADSAPLATAGAPLGKDEALEMLRGLDAPGVGGGPMNGCIQQALEKLKSATSGSRLLAVASDFAQGALELSQPSPFSGENGLKAILLDASAGEAPANLSIRRATIVPADGGASDSWRISALLENGGASDAADVPVTLKVDGASVGKALWNVPGNGASTVTLTYRFPRGRSVRGSLSLPKDALSADDTYHFTLGVPPKAKVLVVNGSPADFRLRDEAFYVLTALDAPASQTSAVATTSLASKIDELDAFDAVFLLNVASGDVDGRTASALEGFVAQGGGLFISLGDQTDPEAFNQRFADLTPRPLRMGKAVDAGSLAVGPEADGAGAGRRPAVAPGVGISKVDASHPALSPFANAGGDSIRSARFTRYFLTEAVQGGSESATLAELEDGAPLLVTGRHGKGRVALFTSTTDRSWNDLPFQPGFLPLVQRMASWLSGSMDAPMASGDFVQGEEVRLPLPAFQGAEAVVLPDGERLALSASPEGTSLNMGRAWQTGVYQVLMASDAANRSSGAAPSGTGAQGDATASSPLPDDPLRQSLSMAFAVNARRDEGDLSHLDEGALRQWFQEGATLRKAIHGGEGVPFGNSQAPAAWLFLLAAICFIAECALIRR